MKHNVSEEVIFPESKTFLQFVADCTDHDMAALDGGETHHGLASVAIADSGGIGATCPAHGVPRDGKGNWDGPNRVGEPRYAGILDLGFLPWRRQSCGRSLGWGNIAVCGGCLFIPYRF